MRMTIPRTILLSLGFCAAAGSLAQDTSSFSSLTWRNIGPDRGGRSLASAGSALRPNEYYFGAVGGGLWKTLDGGTTWKPVTDQKIATSSVGSLAVAPSNPDIVYVGMGETELRGNIMQGDGVYKSTDAGKTWQHAGLENTQSIARLRIDPGDPNTVYAAVLGHPYGKSEDRGVFKTADGGKSWKRILYTNDSAGATDLFLDPQNSKTLFASIWDAQRTPWSLSSGGAASGLFKSTDGGNTWKEITRNPGLPSGIDGKIGVTVSGADSKRIYAIVENQNGGVYRSDNGGDTWQKVNDERDVRQRAFYYTRIIADPKLKDTVYVLNVRFYRSTDGGKTFKSIQQPHGDNHDLWIAPNDSNRMIESNDGGGSVSVDDGASWTRETYPTAQLYHVATTIDIPYHVCGAQQDNTTICVASSGGRNFHNPMGQPQGEWMYAVGGGESGYIAPDPRDANIFFAGSQGAMLSRYDRRDGQQRDVQIYPFFFSGQSASTLKERWQWTFPIVFDPLAQDTLYASSQHLFKTTNEGKNWTSISPDLTRADPKTLGDSGGPITKDQNGPEIYGTIFSIAPSRLEKGTIWTGSDDGLAYLTRDAGKNWTKITPPGLPEFARISMIDASWHKPGTAYLAANHYQLDDRKPYLFKTADYGKTWTSITNGIPDGDFLRVVREDRVRPGLLYAGTENSIYISFDDGEHWRSLALNLPHTQVSDIVVEKHDLVIATHGRSFYVLDDIDSIRQMTSATLQQPVHLYEPRPGIRNVSPAAIDYSLAKPATTVTVDILDESGKTLASYTGKATDKRAEVADAGGGEGRYQAPKPPSVKAGLNRFTWDLRYPGGHVFPGLVIWGARPNMGPAVVPGTYQVRLTVDGTSQTTKLAVAADPRVTDLKPGDLQKQLDLALQIQSEFSQANDMVAAIRKTRDDLDTRIGKAGDPALKSSLDSYRGTLTKIEETLYQVQNRSDQDPLNFPIRLNNYIAALGNSVMTGDTAPTAQAYEVNDILKARLAEQRAAFDSAMGSGLAEVNAALKQHSMPSIAPHALDE